MIMQPTIIEKIKQSQGSNLELVRVQNKVKSGKKSEFQLSENGVLYFRGRLCIPNDAELKKKVMSEAHKSPYSVHQGSTKMYRDL